LVKVICNGSAAVTLFFVLSGFVLGLSLERLKGQFKLKYLVFFLRRLFRIYPAYLVSLVLVCIYLVFFHQSVKYSYTSTWFNKWYQQRLTYLELTKNIFFLSASLNSNAWTIKAEMLGSLLMPIFYFLKMYFGRIQSLYFLGVLIVAGLWTQQEIFITLFMFFLGLILPHYRNIFNCGNSKYAAYVLLMTSVFLWLGTQLSLKIITHNYFMAGRVLEALPAGCIIGFLAYNSFFRTNIFLTNSLLKFYGKISYSFYITQFIVLYFLGVILLDHTPITIVQLYPFPLSVALIIGDIVITTLLAYLVYQYVELYFIRLGKRITSSFSVI
jgi:peptidoglycan/LPS O-acetylase OafA/YrhL